MLEAFDGRKPEWPFLVVSRSGEPKLRAAPSQIAENGDSAPNGVGVLTEQHEGESVLIVDLRRTRMIGGELIIIEGTSLVTSPSHPIALQALDLLPSERF